MFLPVFVCLSVCLWARLLKNAWIWIRCCVSTDVGTWTNWLTFEPDPNHSPDAGTGFSPDFCISAGYLKKLWTCDIWRNYGRISMNFNGSIAAGTWTNWLTFEPDPDHSPDAGTGFSLDFCISAGYLKKLWTCDIWRSYGRISMNFNGSIAAGTWTNWLCFELDTDHSPDPGTVFTPDFWVSARYLKKLWTYFDEILYVDSCGGLHDLIRFWAGSGSEFGSWNRIYTGYFLKILAGYLKKLWTDFDEILCVDSCGGTKKEVLFWPVFLAPTKEEIHVLGRVRLSVCLSVSKITQKRVHGCGWNVTCRQMWGYGRTD